MDLVPFEVYCIFTDDVYYPGVAWGRDPRAVRRVEAHASGRGGTKYLAPLIAERGWDAFDWVVLESGVGDPHERERFWRDLGQLLDKRECLTGRPWSTPLDGVIRGGKCTGPVNVVRMNEVIHSAERRARPEYLAQKARAGRASHGEVQRARPSYRIARVRGAMAGASVAGKHGSLTTNAQRVVCANCCMISTPGPMKLHLNATGHIALEAT